MITTAPPTDTTSPSEAPAQDKPAKLVGLVAALTGVICLMLLAFATPSLNSGAHDLPLAVSGPAAATGQITSMLEQNAPGTFEVQTYANAEEGAEAITNREAIGGISVGANGVRIQTAAGAGSPYKSILTGIGTQMTAAGQQVTYSELAPTTEDDPTGSGIATLGFPLIFGGMAASAVLALAYKGAARNRFVAVTGLAILGGLAAAAILQFGFGAFDGNYLLTSAAVTAGILAIAFPVLGLEQRIGTAGLGLMGVLLMFVSNPLSGLATGPQWLPAFWGDLGQFFPIGAAGTAIRSAVYFGGAGATQAWIVLACWALAGLLIAAVAGKKKAVANAA